MADTPATQENQVQKAPPADGAATEGNDHGLSILLNSKKISYERLPLLEVVFDRLIRVLTSSLRNLTSDNVEITLSELKAERFGDFLDSLENPSMIGVCTAPELEEGPFLLIPDRKLTYSIVDILLGGRKSELSVQSNRPYTTIERGLVERLFLLVLEDFSSSFEPIRNVNFQLDRTEVNPRFAAIIRPTNAVIRIILDVYMENRGGKLDFILPYSTLEPVRDHLLQMFMGEKFGSDSIWENHLRNELWNTEFELEGILGEALVDLKTVLEWSEGSELLLPTTPESPVDLRCGDVVLAKGRLGRKNGIVALKVENTFLDRRRK